MLGCRSGFQALVKQKSANVIGAHFFIHRQALILKNAPNDFYDVLNSVKNHKLHQA